jgi:hypothetical protein
LLKEVSARSLRHYDIVPDSGLDSAEPRVFRSERDVSTSRWTFLLHEASRANTFRSARVTQVTAQGFGEVSGHPTLGSVLVAGELAAEEVLRL